MATASDPSASGAMPFNTRTTAAERRKMVLLGELPPDFLRLSVPMSAAPSSSAQRPVGQQVVIGQQQVPIIVTNPAQHNILQAQQAFYSFAPANTRGRIAITIVEAKLAKNYGIVRMDPYCRIRVGNAVFETPTNISGGKAPKWNRIVNAYLPHGVESVYVQIFDERAFTNDECVAWAHIVLPNGIFNGEVIDDWYQLSGQQGEGKEGVINIITSFQPHEPPQNVEGQQVQPEAAEPPGPLFTEEEANELHDMFPNVDADVIKCILEEKRGNKDATVTAILEMTSGQ